MVSIASGRQFRPSERSRDAIFSPPAWSLEGAWDRGVLTGRGEGGMGLGQEGREGVRGWGTNAIQKRGQRLSEQGPGKILEENA